jgi:glucose-1-phosphate thymidylyltransferase
MKALIPAAGVGTRLRPHTLNKPKALLPVAGKPILAHIVDDLVAAGIEECVIVIGFHGEAVRRWFARERPELAVRFVDQPRRLGLGHAVWSARGELGDEPFFCILGDTILKADVGRFIAATTNVVGVREVADPRRFGIVELEAGRVRRFVEKPDDPTSNLAIVGAYAVRDAAALWSALTRVVEEDRRTKNEYQLTDGLQLMIEAGAEFETLAVEDWYDCGKRETWLETNRVLLERAASAPAAAGVEPPCVVAGDAELIGSRIGPYVSIGSRTRLENCELANCVIGSDSELVDCSLSDSLVGDHCRLRGVRGRVDIGDFGGVVAQAE